ncbi:MetQ/NlpA family ABC transporter substrate-binding protein [Rothia sp. (in: high G+C Gram-positive bacteria)]|uniref:MetQ/NlpA family ABC transporter substrate-binding protein n=1 Tax=Rothia sp. (in: high G+C Gram-positive bacteria) TaxID=1885016 RepID=UPI000EE4EBB3|nr:methionine-binding protein [Rothia sp. (in: high G+C Gram-positive bacteria)]
MKKFVASLALVPLAFGLAACGSSDSASSSDETVRIGVVGSSDSNKKLVEVAAEEGINVELVEFSDYTQPNPALNAGDIDMNWFQHIAYLSDYNVKNDDNLQIVGPTVIYPMAMFSTTHSSISDLPDGAEVAIPNDTVNEARALKLLEANGLVSFTSEVDTPTIDDVDSAASKVKVTPVDATQTVISMESVDASVINNDFLMDAGLDPKNALAQDDPANESARPYVNLFVAQADDADNETYKKIVEIFHTDAVLQAVQEETQGTAVEVDIDLEELRSTLATLEDKLRG